MAMDKWKITLIAVAVLVVVVAVTATLVAVLVNWGGNKPHGDLPTEGQVGPKKIDSNNKVANEWFVVLSRNNANERMDEIEQDLDSVDMPWSVGGRYPNMGLMQMTCPDDVLEDAMAMPKMRQHAKYVEANAIINASQLQWNLDRIDQRNLPLDGLPFSTDTDGTGVNIYVVDTGIRFTHQDFGGRAISAYSSINDINGASDCNGHGTHVSGTAGGNTFGVARGALLHSVRVLNCEGSGSIFSVVSGLNWVANNRVLPAVASVSLGGVTSISIDDAAQDVIDSGVTFVVAAGNDAADACFYSPARVPDAITVGSTGLSDQISTFSNFGTCLDIFAPGNNVLSAWYTGNAAQNSLSGTSMATPHVSGVAALYLQANPTATPAQVREFIVSSATKDVVTNLNANTANNLVYYPNTNSNTGTTATSTPATTGDGTTTGTATTGLPPPPTAPPECGDCVTIDGSIAAEDGSQYFSPTDNNYYLAPAGTHKGFLKGPTNADFDLYLYKWTTSSWAVAARSISVTSDEKIEYEGEEGYYIWRVQSWKGVGAFSLGLSVPTE